jgi:CDP-glucose 4,6-dehydratase
LAGRNVFVTGCTGLLGSWLTMALAESGANVVGLIRDWVPRSNLNWSGFTQRITTVRGDVTDYALVERALSRDPVPDCERALAALTRRTKCW